MLIRPFKPFTSAFNLKRATITGITYVVSDVSGLSIYTVNKDKKRLFSFVIFVQM